MPNYEFLTLRLAPVLIDISNSATVEGRKQSSKLLRTKCTDIAAALFISLHKAITRLDDIKNWNSSYLF